MATYNPHAVMREADTALKRAQKVASKAQATILRLSDANQDPKLQRGFGVLLDQMRRLDGELSPSLMTQYRQDERLKHPREHPGQPEPPTDLTCKLCRRVREAEDFRFDDGHGYSAYSQRCSDCRGPGRRHGLERPHAES